MTREGVAVPVVGLGLVVSLLAAPSEVYAQGEEVGDTICGDIVACNGGEDGHHWLLDSDTEFREWFDESGEGHGYHGDCRQCISLITGQWVSPGNCHPFCDGGANLPEEQQLAYQSMIDAANEGDASGVVVFAQQVPSRAQIDLLRGSIQVLDCSSNIIANLPVENAFEHATKLALARIVVRGSPFRALGLQRPPPLKP